MASTFNCVVITPEAKSFDGRVSHVAVPLHDGSMGFEAGRAAIVAEMGYGPLKLTKDDGQEATLFCGGGFAQMQGDTLTVLTPECMPADQVDASQAQAALDEARAMSAVGDVQYAEKTKRENRARGMLSVAKG